MRDEDVARLSPLGFEHIDMLGRYVFTLPATFRRTAMKLASTRLIVSDIKGMVSFYETVTGLTAEWLAPVFAEIVTPAATLAIGSVETVALWKEGSAEPGTNRTACIEFQVEDIDAHYERLKGKVPLVHEMKLMPWGNKTFQFRIVSQRVV